MVSWRQDPCPRGFRGWHVHVQSCQRPLISQLSLRRPRPVKGAARHSGARDRSMVATPVLPSSLCPCSYCSGSAPGEKVFPLHVVPNAGLTLT